MMTLRSRDFFIRVLINPQEVMMVLSPMERLRHTHRHTQTRTQRGSREEAGLTVLCVEFHKFIEIPNLCNGVFQRNVTHVGSMFQSHLHLAHLLSYSHLFLFVWRSLKDVSSPIRVILK